MATAFIGGMFTLAGVIVNAVSQRKPEKVEPDDDPCAKCLAELIEMRADRDRWRNIAETFMPHRRSDDDGVSPGEPPAT